MGGIGTPPIKEPLQNGIPTPERPNLPHAWGRNQRRGFYGPTAALTPFNLRAKFLKSIMTGLFSQKSIVNGAPFTTPEQPTMGK